MGRATNIRRLQVEGDGGWGCDGEASASSSTDSNGYYNNPFTNTSSSSSTLCTDLRLGLTISSSSNRRSGSGSGSLFVKVYKEGIPIGRKLDLKSHDGYHSLLPTLSHMFNIPILCPSVNYEHISERDHILTYEDKDGDWMLVGDVPWEMFLSSVKKLKITKADA